MLPGFRFLLAAIFLSVSIVTFGLGAAALLRAAHEEFASIPTRRATPEPYFVQAPEPPAATLAMLRVEPAPPANAPATPPAPALAEEPALEAVPVPKVEITKLAAPNLDVAPSAEPAKPEVAATEPIVVAPSRDETLAEVKTAALDVTPAPGPAPVVENTPAPSEQIVMPAMAIETMTDGNPVATGDKPTAKVAALGSPATSVVADADTRKAKPDRAEIRKKQRAERAKERRRLAARRARLAAQQAAAAAAPTAVIQQPAGFFGEAEPQTQPATTRRR